jgi:hypothetical protein
MTRQVTNVELVSAVRGYRKIDVLVEAMVHRTYQLPAFARNPCDLMQTSQPNINSGAVYATRSGA